MNLVELVRKAGVVGAGGAGFPTYVKLQSKPELIIVNGAECEPLLYVDQYLMNEYSEVLIETLENIRQFTGAEKAIFALKEKYQNAWDSLSKASRKLSNIELFPLGSYYPTGDEHVLVYDVTGKTIPPGGIPIDIGIVTINVETLFNVSKAMKGEPVINSFLTLTGEVDPPVTLSVPIGTVMGDLLKRYSKRISPGVTILDGGPMMGFIRKKDASIVKTTKGLILLNENHPLIKRRLATDESILKIARSVCCHCNFCTENCPRYLLGHKLEPHRIMWGMSMGDIDKAQILSSVELCCQCGICELWACPMEISVRTLIGRLKSTPGEKTLDKTDMGVHYEYNDRRIPTSRLVARVGLTKYDKPAPFRNDEWIPKKVKIPLKQHIGVPASPVVKVGDNVEQGQVIGDVPEDKLGVPVHASIFGQVTGIDGVITIER